MEKNDRSKIDVIKSYLVNLVKYAGSYIAFGITYILCSKKVLSATNYDYPFFQVMCNNAMTCFILSFYIVCKYPNSLNFNQFLSFKIIVIGVLSGLDYGLSALSFEHVSVLIYTVVKSLSPFFVMLLSFYFKLEKVNFILVLSICLICLGVSIASLKSLYSGEQEQRKSTLMGIIYVAIASVCQSIRIVFCQLLMQAKEERMESPLLMFYTNPVSACVMLLFGLVNDFPKLMSRIPEYPEVWYFNIVTLYLFMSFLATFLTIGQFGVVEHFSSLTLTICSKVREVFLLLLSLLIFGDDWNVFTISGWSIVACGILFFNGYKIWSASFSSSSASKFQVGTASSGRYKPISAIDEDDGNGAIEIEMEDQEGVQEQGGGSGAGVEAGNEDEDGGVIPKESRSGGKEEV